MANFIWKNRHGRYYFRVRIPALYRDRLSIPELRSPLRTCDRAEAKRLARAHMVAFDKLLAGLDEMAKKSPSSVSVDYQLTLDTEDLPDGRRKTTTRIEITPEETADLGGPEAVAKLLQSIDLNQTAIDKVGRPQKSVTARHGSSHLTLSKAIDKFIAAKSKSWTTAKTETQYRGTFNLMLQHFGDRRLDEIKKAEATDFFDLIGKLPANFNHVHSKYKGMALDALADLNQVERIKPKTHNDHLIRLRALYNWAMKISDDPLTNPFDAVDSIRRRGAGKREPFTKECLDKIFSSYLFSDKEEWPNRKKSIEPSKYWVPLLLAYTGCRINEICQLYLDDLVADTESGVIFTIQATREDQSIKNGIWRKIPAHPILLSVGLKEYVESLKLRGESRLFPELSYSKAGDGYSRTIGEFLNSLYKDVGAKGTNHSFRHLVVKTMARSNVPKEIIKAIVGHYDPKSTEDMTDRYGGTDKYSIKQKQDAIRTLRYGFEDSIINFRGFVRRSSVFRHGSK